MLIYSLAISFTFTLSIGYGTKDWFQVEKGVHQDCILSPCLFNLHAEYSMRNARLEEAQAGIKIARRNINNLRYADDTIFMVESEEELKNLLMKMKEESEKVGLKLNRNYMVISTDGEKDFDKIQHPFMIKYLQKKGTEGIPYTIYHIVSGSITSWEMDGGTVETVVDFIFLGFKITADGDCSHEIKRCLLLERKVMTNIDSILKSRDITLLTKVHLVKALVFPVVMYGCESWTITKAECHGIDAFELWCWRRLLRVP